MALFPLPLGEGKGEGLSETQPFLGLLPSPDYAKREIKNYFVSLLIAKPPSPRLICRRTRLETKEKSSLVHCLSAKPSPCPLPGGEGK